MADLHTILTGARPGQRGLFCVCSASEPVLRAAARHAAAGGYTVAIEATANQVDQFGGYTGLRPADYAQKVEALAREEGLPRDRLVLGGDHLGPLTWCGLPEAEAMERAEALVRAYVLAGFEKIHIDTSMRLGDDDPQAPLDVAVCARRGARLAQVVWDAFRQRRSEHPDSPRPVLVIGSEVPIPGGSRVHEDTVTPTAPEDFRRQLGAFRAAFDRAGVPFDDVVAFVVQPGVEFGDDFVCQYDPAAAAGLMASRQGEPVVFEAHSTDYQTEASLSALTADGAAILKVGPALTFALREGLFLLEEIEGELGVSHPSGFRAALLAAMDADDRNWRRYYTGTPEEVAYKKLYSYSDRCRYYLPQPGPRRAMEVLLDNLREIPPALLSQYLPRQYQRYMEGRLAANALAVLCDRVGDVLDGYARACGIPVGQAARDNVIRG